ncbi:unnamed protein product [Cylindrotheca closterium]|uniref:Nuclear pore complex protein Nup85 n=1 Tax=Cylindrotheca closterium TaxID=2856 RepID=A0AAD2PV99_9STRA|nr:unnamed protein product [Cylindrotheca closterium]
MSIPAKKGNAVVWNPHNPASLLVPTVRGESDGAFATNTFLSHDGVGCNDHERTAVMDLLDAQDAYLQSPTGPQALLSLSKSYRRALSNCLQGWEDELLSSEQQDDAADAQDGSISSNLENLELLKVAYAVTHLSETFLLLPANDQVMDFYESTTNLPGAVTAETVRYLRLHHMTEASDFLDEETLDNLFQSIQPDQWEGTGAVYWQLLEKYVVRGNLEDAWGLLTRHSLCRRCTEAIAAAASNSSSNVLAGLDEYTAASLQEDREGLEALRAILLSAPLPGGRTDQFDAVLADDDDYRKHGGDDGQEFDEDDPNNCYIEGIPLSAYRLWETSSKRRGKGDMPSAYNDQYSKQVYRSWQQSIRSLPALDKLCRRMPSLRKILDILNGDFSKVQFDSWAEQFCAELLYKAPDLRLVDMNIRAMRVIEQHNKNDSQMMSDESGGGMSEFEEVVLSVMKGNAGRVIEVMHQLGGGSGAALPAVMTSLLCNLLHDAEILPEVSTSYSLKTELLLNAAFAIHSSLATEGHSDVATRLTARFLVPHIKVRGDIRIAATLVETLEHHYPKSDAEANALLALCRSLVERKNVRVLDGCVSICLARYRYYLKDQRPGGAFHWLLVGMEFESLILSTRNDSSKMMIDSSENAIDTNWQRAQETGVCHRLLVNYCLETTRGLLKEMLGEGEEGFAILHGRAKEMIATAVEETDFSTFIRSARALENMLLIANAIAEDKGDRIVADNIVALLEERADEEENGVVSSLARFSMHWDILKLAKGVLRRDADLQSGVGNQKGFKSSFDVNGMKVLLERFTVISAAKDMEKAPLVPEETKGMRLALGEGLMRALVVENATKRIHMEASKTSISGIYSSDLGKHSREKQELVVARMLD